MTEQVNEFPEADAEEPEVEKEDPLVRFGVSMPALLVKQLDEWKQLRGYPSRSEAVRDAVRQSLVEMRWNDSEDQKTERVGVVTLVYQHGVRQLSEHLIEIQHHTHTVAIASMHIHLTHENCLEVIVLRGPQEEVATMADHLISAKGVIHGKFVPMTTGVDIA